MEKKGAKIRLISQIVFGAFTVALGVLFLLHVWDIYLSNPTGVGSDTYSREIVGEHLLQLLPFCIAWLVLAIGAFVVEKFFPKKVTLSFKDDKTTLARLTRRISAVEEGEPLFHDYKKLQERAFLRKIVRFALAISVVISFVFLSVYFFNSANFPSENVNREVVAALVYAAPFLVGLFLVACGVEIFERVTLKQELTTAKTLLAATAKTTKTVKRAQTEGAEGTQTVNTTKTTRFWESEKFVFGARVVLAVAGVAFVVVGICNGGVGDVLKKAIAICTECIGLG